MKTVATQADVFFTLNGKEECDHEDALAILLMSGVLFANQRPYIEAPWNEERVVSEKTTVVLFVNCNDVFAWGSADAEELMLDEVGQLYKMVLADERFGASKWCCLKRNERPQAPLERKMREAGVWDEQMEALPTNTSDAEVQAMFRAVRQGEQT